MERFLKVEYIGKNTENILETSQIAKYYRTIMQLDGRDVIVYLDQRYNIMENGRKPILRVRGWLDMDDPRVNEIYTSSNESQNFERAPEPIQTQIDLSQVQVYLPDENYLDATKSEQDRGRNILEAQLFEMKKRLILSERKAQFYERLDAYEAEHPEIRIDSILSELNDEEKERAKDLHDKMMKCVIMGKYSYRCYISFMQNLVSIIRGNNIALSSRENVENLLYGRKTKTFSIPGNRFIARFCHDEARPYRKSDILNIDFGTQKLDIIKNFLNKNNRSTDSTDWNR